MATYSVAVDKEYEYSQVLLDGLKELVATHHNLGKDEGTIQKQALDKYISSVSNHLSYISHTGHTARFLNQIVTIRATMKDIYGDHPGIQKMDKLVTALLEKLRGEEVSKVKP